jgi:HEAT repeat protein
MNRFLLSTFLLISSAAYGRAAEAAREPGIVSAADAFPGWGPLGAPEDPLQRLAREDEGLRDSYSSALPASRLQDELRGSNLAGKLNAVRESARPRNVAAIPTLSGVLLRWDLPAPLRAAAALALGRIKDRVALTILTQGLQDPSPDVRAASALALGRIHAPKSAPYLEHALFSDLAWPTRYAAAVALARFPGSDRPLSTALSVDASWQVRQQAARSLQFTATPLSLRTLTQALADTDPSVRASAAYSLGEIGGMSERRRLGAALRVETDPSARLAMQDAERVALSRP